MTRNLFELHVLMSGLLPERLDSGLFEGATGRYSPTAVHNFFGENTRILLDCIDSWEVADEECSDVSSSEIIDTIVKGSELGIAPDKSHTGEDSNLPTQVANNLNHTVEVDSKLLSEVPDLKKAGNLAVEDGRTKDIVDLSGTSEKSNPEQRVPGTVLKGPKRMAPIVFSPMEPPVISLNPVVFANSSNMERRKLQPASMLPNGKPLDTALRDNFR